MWVYNGMKGILNNRYLERMKIYSKTRNGEDNMGINGDQELKTSSAIK